MVTFFQLIHFSSGLVQDGYCLPIKAVANFLVAFEPHMNTLHIIITKIHVLNKWSRKSLNYVEY